MTSHAPKPKTGAEIIMSQFENVNIASSTILLSIITLGAIIGVAFASYVYLYDITQSTSAKTPKQLKRMSPRPG